MTDGTLIFLTGFGEIAHIAGTVLVHSFDLLLRLLGAIALLSWAFVSQFLLHDWRIFVVTLGVLLGVIVFAMLKFRRSATGSTKE